MTRFALPLFAALFGCALVPSALAQTLQDRFPGADEMKPGPPPDSDQAPAKPAKPARPAKAAAKPAAAAGEQDKPARGGHRADGPDRRVQRQLREGFEPRKAGNGVRGQERCVG